MLTLEIRRYTYILWVIDNNNDNQRDFSFELLFIGRLNDLTGVRGLRLI